MACEVSIVKDSVSANGCRLTTFQLKYWRACHSEFMTHRMFSRNASSSRAIPVTKMIDQVRNDPAGPIYWGANQSGMQADGEISQQDRTIAKQKWKDSANVACDMAEGLLELNLHKQVVNRLLEPFQWIHVIVTATDYDNFFALRCHPAAQPEIQELAYNMMTKLSVSNPTHLNVGEWHLPYVTDEELDKYGLDTMLLASTARCARVSYLTHDGQHPDIGKDVLLHKRLVGSHPIHASPCEHQATPIAEREYIRNFNGWKMYRTIVEERLGD